MTARSEPLLWLQLIALGAWPVEALLLLLILAGADPGPLPGLERILCWSIGALAPALLFLRSPPDVWSLLLVQTPWRGRRTLQNRLSALQQPLLLQAGLWIGVLLLLALLWWMDQVAPFAAGLSPLAASSRLLILLLAAMLLALMLWQWQQVLQALWLLTRIPGEVEATTPLQESIWSARRLSLGLPLLLPSPLLQHRPDPTRPISRPLEAPSAEIAPVAIEVEEAKANPKGAELDQEID